MTEEFNGKICNELEPTAANYEDALIADDFGPVDPNDTRIEDVNTISEEKDLEY